MWNFHGSWWGKLLRWILFLPLASLAYYLVNMLVNLARQDGWSDYTVPMIITYVIATALSNSAFLWTMVFLVPTYKKVITSVVCAPIVLSHPVILTLAIIEYPGF